MQQGYIKLHRQLLDTDIFENPKLLKVFIWCLLKATHTDREQRVGRKIVKLRQGQFIFGRAKASLELDIPQSTIWDYMKLLENRRTISIKSNNKYSVVTIENWGLYQNNDDFPTAKPTINGQQMDTNKNVKNVKNNIYSRIIDYLNQKASKSFKCTTKKTKSCIDARLREGFKEADFLKVIDIKTEEWKDNPNMNRYLRPETLFGVKFEGYLQQDTKQDQSEQNNFDIEKELEKYKIVRPDGTVVEN